MKHLSLNPVKRLTAMLTLLAAVALIELKAQDNNTLKPVEPGIQWDTVKVIIHDKYPEHLVGIRYNFSFTGVMMSPDLEVKGVIAPVNVAILYTYYNPLWGWIDLFGLQTGIQFSQYGFKNGKYNYQNFEQKVSVIEIPFVSSFHYDIGESFRILAGIGPFIGYRAFTTKSNGFDCFDNRFDYGLVATLGLAYILGRVEFHLEGSFNYSLSMLYHPERMSSSWWLYTYPWRAGINFGVHLKL